MGKTNLKYLHFGLVELKTSGTLRAIWVIEGVDNMMIQSYIFDHQCILYDLNIIYALLKKNLLNMRKQILFLLNMIFNFQDNCIFNRRNKTISN